MAATAPAAAARSEKALDADEELNQSFEEIYSNSEANTNGYRFWTANAAESSYEGFYDGEEEAPHPPAVTQSFHDEIVAICQDTGISSIAADAGIIQNGEIPSLKQYPAAEPDPEATLSTSTPAAKPTSSGVTTRLLSSPSLRERERKEQSPPSSPPSQLSSKKRKVDKRADTDGKNSKGLRHFSLKVCSKVEAKKTTSYNEVADELVLELQAEAPNSTALDQKNIRRRVYDALNVLMAMGVISKEKKQIRWIGLPFGPAKSDARAEAAKLETLEREKQERMETIRRKREDLQSLSSAYLSFKKIIQRNQLREEKTPNTDLERIHAPFLLVKAPSNSEINCEMTEARTEYHFEFSQPFSIHDANSVLPHVRVTDSPSG